MKQMKSLLSGFKSKRKWRLYIIGILIIFSRTLFSQQLINGVVVDAETNLKISYATVNFKKSSALTNVDGEFILKSNDTINWVIVKSIGYKTDTIFINDSMLYIQVRLKKIPRLINEITIQAESNNERFIIFSEAIHYLKKKFEKSMNVKSFFRSYTLVDSNRPAELFEAYYNVECDKYGIHNPHLKAGRFIVPIETSFFNMSSLSLIENFNPLYDDYQDIFPSSPFKNEDWRLIKENYKLQILDKTPVSDGDTLLHFKFTSKLPSKSFSGELYYHNSTHYIERIVLTIDNADKIPLSSIKDSSSNKISNLIYNIEIGFDYVKDKARYKYIVFNYEFNMSSPKQKNHIFTSMKLLFYDYGSKFQTPIIRSIISQTDYQKVAFYPYNEYFFERNPVILENEAELKIIKKFKDIPSYDSKIKNYYSIPFLPHIVEEWYADWSPNIDLVSKFSIPKAHYRLKYYKDDRLKNDWDSSFASTMLYLDYDCYPDTVVFQTNALFDYKYSYSLNQDSVSMDYFKMYFEITKIASYHLLWTLIKKFRNKCPSEKEVLKIFDKINMSFENDINTTYTNLNSKNKDILYPKFRKLLEGKLKYAERMLGYK